MKTKSQGYTIILVYKVKKGNVLGWDFNDFLPSNIQLASFLEISLPYNPHPSYDMKMTLPLPIQEES